MKGYKIPKRPKAKAPTKSRSFKIPSVRPATMRNLGPWKKGK